MTSRRAMNLSYREDYWDSPELKKQFLSFLIQIHGLDLSLWDEMGLWDRKYRPFSYFDGDSLVSSLCIYSMDMTIQGKKRPVAQVSAVGTLPEYRRKGLNLELTQKAMDWARVNHDFFFLFADDEAFPFYEKCGFRQVDEYKSSVSVSGETARPGADKLDIQRKDHLDLIYRIASDRESVSDVLGVLNKRLFMFWCLYFLADHIYYIAELDVLILYKRDNELVTVFDIVGKNVPAFSEVYPYICAESDETVEFLFMVDKLNLETFDQVRVEDNGTHLLGDFPLESGKFIFPYTAHA
jgi:GNAT superfamily N-acetyltransferase